MTTKKKTPAKTIFIRVMALVLAGLMLASVVLAFTGF